MEGFLIQVFEELSTTVLCPKCVLADCMVSNKKFNDYICKYCTTDQCNRCWLDLGEKILEGAFTDDSKENS